VWLKELTCSGIDLIWRIYLCTVGIPSVVESTDMFRYRSNLENISVYCMVYGVWLKEQICPDIDLTWRIYLCTVRYTCKKSSLEIIQR